MNGTGWTIERTDLLRQLWLQRVSASQIAAQLGMVSRSAVIGKAHRLGLSQPKGTRLSTDEVNQRRRERRRERAGEAVERRLNGGWGDGWSWRKRTSESPTKPSGLSVPAGAKSLTILELTAETCRWPLWGQDKREGLYCGGRIVPGHVWCTSHCCLAYRSPDSRSKAA